MNLLDNFNRANEGPPLSSSWKGYGGGFSVDNNLAKPHAPSGPNAALWNQNIYKPDQEAFLTVATKPTNSSSSLGLFLRIDDYLNGYMATFVPQDNVDKVRIWKVSNGVASMLGTDILKEFNVGDKFIFKASGNILSVYHKTPFGSWTFVCSRTNSSYNHPGKIGLYAAGDSGRADDFGGGGEIY
jgi:hypothetical protein